MRAAGRRLGANPDDLAGLAELQRELDDALTAAVLTARAKYGMSWSEIGGLLGVSRQAAQQRFGPKLGTVGVPSMNHDQLLAAADDGEVGGSASC